MRRSSGLSGFLATGWFRASAVAAFCIISACGKGPIEPTPSAPPSVTCPANLSVTGVVGGMQSVTYTAPVVTGGAAPLTTTCSPSSGSPFPTGATTVNCTVTDAQNRQATCSFSVTLQPLVLNVRRWVAFGDSVTAGEDGRRLQIRFGFVDPVKAYPAVLQSLLTADFPNHDLFVANEGHGGVRATDDVKNLQGILQTYRAEAVLLLHGYNDLLNGGVAAAGPVAFALRDDIRIAHAQGVQHVFLGTLTPSRPATGPFNRTIDPRAIQETNARLVQVAAAERAILVNTFDAFKGRELELVEVDGLHPTVMGSQVLAETFYRAIRAAGLTMGVNKE
jgi:lysophospholipase L1-like esterase